MCAPIGSFTNESLRIIRVPTFHRSSRFERTVPMTRGKPFGKSPFALRIFVPLPTMLLTSFLLTSMTASSITIESSTSARVIWHLSPMAVYGPT